MIADLRERFLPRFIQTARQRVAKARGALDSAQGMAVAVTEFHALAGEAAILELFDIATLARQGEKAARGASSRGPGEARAECDRVLGQVETAVDGLLPPA